MKTVIVVLAIVSGRAAAAPAPAPAVSGGMPAEVIIKAEGTGSKLSDSKPPLKIEVDAFETIRPSLKPDENLLLAVSPLTVSWRRTHPEFLYVNRVIQPWRTTFSQRSGIGFRIREQLASLDRKSVV